MIRLRCSRFKSTALKSSDPHFSECQQHCLNLARFCFKQGGLGWRRCGCGSSVLWDSWR